MARILAIDYGSKRSGLAVTDPLQLIVNGLDTVDTEKLWDFLEDYLKKEEVEMLVIGEARHVDGSPVAIEKKIAQFMAKLKKKYPDLPINREDESFTSHEAKHILVESGLKKMKRREKGRLDRISAILILQRYLGHI
jgi:putative Holliday junction resolvase